MGPASLLDSFSQEARDSYDNLRTSVREIGPDGREFVLLTPFAWFGSGDGNLRIESRAFGLEKPLERVTNVAIWTSTSRIEGVQSHGTPDKIVEFEQLTVEQSLELWSAGRIPFDRLRTYKGGYIELVSYAIDILAESRDAMFGREDVTQTIWGRSDRWRVYLEADATTGEVRTVALGLGENRTARYEYEGRLPDSIYPARHPLREYNIRFDSSERSTWWTAEDAPPRDGYWRFLTATSGEPEADLFTWHDPNWQRSSTHDPKATEIDSDRSAQTEPIFVPSKTTPGRMVPNSPTSKATVVLLAAGAALVLAGGILVIRRRTG